jgi:hypothetical protein
MRAGGLVTLSLLHGVGAVDSRLAEIGEGQQCCEPHGADPVPAKPHQTQRTALALGRNGERRGQSLGTFISDSAFPKIQGGQALRPGGGGELGSEGGGANITKTAVLEHEACK